VALIVLDTDVVSLFRMGRLPLERARQVTANDSSIAFATAAQRPGRPRPLHDSWIAACCLERQLPMLTLNRRDFADFAEHDGLVLLV
jgi:predicted nucleic acid-binding protein